MRSVVGITILLTLVGFSLTHLSDEYQNKIHLDDKNETKPTFMMFWTYNSNESSVSFAVKARAKGWVAFGFANKIDEMKGYDVVVGHIETILNETSQIKDYHTIGHKPPVEDAQQDLMNTSVSEEGDFTTLKFIRLLNTTDIEEDIVIKPGPMIVVWSYSNQDVLTLKHVERGYKKVTLIPDEQAAPLSLAVVCHVSWMLIFSTSSALIL